MDRLLRGMFVVGNQAWPEECINNWRKFNEARLEPSLEEDKKILDLISRNFRQQEAPLDSVFIREYFEKRDDIETANRIDELRKVKHEIQTNYVAQVQAARETQHVLEVQRIAKEAAVIAEHGLRVGKEWLKGPKAAASHFAEQSRLIEEKRDPDPFDFMDWRDLDKPVTPPQYLLRHFRFCAGRPVIIGGYVGIAKTFLAIDLALAVASGQKTAWGDLHVSLKGPVAHLDYEMGKSALLDRYQRMAHSRDITLSLIDLSISCFPKIYLSSRGAEVEFEKIGRKHRLCIIDSFAASTVGKIEENSSQVAQYLHVLSRASDRTGCCFVLLHHERKDSEKKDHENELDDIQRLRGSSAIAGALGAAVSVRHMKDGTYRIRQSKVSAGRSGDPVYLNLVDEGKERPAYENTEGIFLQNSRVAHESVQAAEEKIVLSLIRQHPGEKRDVVYRAVQEAGLTIGTHKLKKILDELTQSGAIQKSSVGWTVTSTEDLLT
jgi:hypothetical protein